MKKISFVFPRSETPTPSVGEKEKEKEASSSSLCEVDDGGVISKEPSPNKKDLVTESPTTAPEEGGEATAEDTTVRTTGYGWGGWGGGLASWNVMDKVNSVVNVAKQKVWLITS